MPAIDVVNLQKTFQSKRKAAGLARFALGVFLAAVVFVSFLILVQSLAFWIGNTDALGNMAVNAMVTFAIYPITLFDTTAKVLLFTLIPAALMGALPAEFVRSFSWVTLGQLALSAALFLGAALVLFRAGLRRYESGSAIQVEV